jgi:hypothetical protein
MSQSPRIHRNFGMELVRVTEAAALACAPFMGRGDGVAGDRAATDAMRAVLGLVEMDGERLAAVAVDHGGNLAGLAQLAGSPFTETFAGLCGHGVVVSHVSFVLLVGH